MRRVIKTRRPIAFAILHQHTRVTNTTNVHRLCLLVLSYYRYIIFPLNMNMRTTICIQYTAYTIGKIYLFINNYHLVLLIIMPHGFCSVVVTRNN